MAACTGTRPQIERHPVQKGDVRNTFADTTAARRALGFRHTMLLDAGIEAEYQWMSNTVPVV